MILKPPGRASAIVCDLETRTIETLEAQHAEIGDRYPVAFLGPQVCRGQPRVEATGSDNFASQFVCYKPSILALFVQQTAKMPSLLPPVSGSLAWPNIPM